jgi:holo-[acyl-carrier protein] synthase
MCAASIGNAMSLADAGKMRVRVGVDAVEVDRLARVLGDDFRRQERFFTRRELDYCRPRRRCSEHLAARFAAKEAVLKAFGEGLGPGMRWKDVEVVNEESGRPRIELDGAVAAFAERNGLRELDVSLTHTAGLALAQVVTLWERPAGSG